MHMDLSTKKKTLLYSKVTKLMYELGFTMKLKGERRLREVVVLLAYDYSNSNVEMNDLYWKFADGDYSTMQTVRSTISVASKSVFSRNKDSFREILDITERPSNEVVIRAMATYITK